MAETPLWSHEVKRQGEDTVVRLTGELDIAANDRLRDVLLEELDRAGLKQLTADLGAVSFLDSTALSSLLLAHNTARDRDRGFTVANARQTVRRVLEVTGLYDVLTGP